MYNFVLTQLKMILAQAETCSVNVSALNDYIEFKFVRLKT